MSVTTSSVEYQADGMRYVGCLAVDEGLSGRRPGVLVIPDGLGLGPHAKAVAERLARLGYVALGVDYHGEGRRFSLTRDLDEVLVRMQERMSEPDGVRAVGAAALAALASHPRVDPERLAAIGYSYGGCMALELARTGANLKAVVSFHGGLGTVLPLDGQRIRARVLILVGADDPVVTSEARAAFAQEMDEGAVDWRIVLYGGARHSFTNPIADGSRPGLAYDAVTDRRSWRAMLDHLEETLGCAREEWNNQPN